MYHTCWLVTYPLSGWLLTVFGVVPALIGLALLAAIGMLAAFKMWPANFPVELEQTHDKLPLYHPHLQGHRRHSHALVIDDRQPRSATHF